MPDDLYREGCAWIDGDYLPISEARIPIIDSGFSRSDVTYDVVAVWNGKFFRLDDHLARFESSWRRLRMSPPVSPDVIRDILFQCVRRSGLQNAYVDMIMSRGTPPPGIRDPRRFVNCFYAYAIPYVWIVQLRTRRSERTWWCAGTRCVFHRNRSIPRSRIFSGAIWCGICSKPMTEAARGRCWWMRRAI